MKESAIRRYEILVNHLNPNIKKTEKSEKFPGTFFKETIKSAGCSSVRRALEEEREFREAVAKAQQEHEKKFPPIPESEYLSFNSSSATP